MKQLFIESLFRPFILFPTKSLVMMLMCLIGKYSFVKLLTEINVERHRGRVQFLKTLFFNFMSMPFSQARVIPIYIYSKVEIIHCGKIRFNTNQVFPGMIRWGRYDLYRSQGVTRINNNGTIIFEGNGRILRGAELFIWKKASFYIGDNFFFGEDTLISCQEYIKIGKYFRLAYQSQLLDTDYHYSVKIDNGEVRKKSRPIIIGDYNWIGNRCTIKKGTVTPNHTTVAGSYTVLSKDYTKNTPEYSILGGIPAKLLVTGYSRLWNAELERVSYLDNWFENHPDTTIYKYNMEDICLEDLTENEGSK